MYILDIIRCCDVVSDYAQEKNQKHFLNFEKKLQIPTHHPKVRSRAPKNSVSLRETEKIVSFFKKKEPWLSAMRLSLSYVIGMTLKQRL